MEIKAKIISQHGAHFVIMKLRLRPQSNQSGAWTLFGPWYRDKYHAKRKAEEMLDAFKDARVEWE